MIKKILILLMIITIFFILFYGGDINLYKKEHFETVSKLDICQYNDQCRDGMKCFYAGTLGQKEIGRCMKQEDCYEIDKKENISINNSKCVTLEKKIILIKDTQNVLQDGENNNIAVLKNIKNFKNIEVGDSVIKMMLFKNSQMRLTNLKDISKFTLAFNIEFLDITNHQIIINCLTNDDFTLWAVYIENNKIYVTYKNKTKKLIKITKNKLHNLVINYELNKLTVYLNNDSVTITNEKQYSNNDNNILIGGLFKNNKLLNPIHAFIGNINLYKEIINPFEVNYNTDFKFNLNEFKKKLPICSFKPKGKSINECSEECRSTEGCNINYCMEICNNCIDYNNCEWVSKPVIREPIVPEPVIPKAPKIKCFPGDNTIELRFKKPYDGNSPISSYLVTLKKSYKNDFLRINKISDDTCNRHSCKYVFNELDNQEYYDIKVRAINAVGMSPFSNTETIAPNGEKEAKQISSALLETDTEIKKKVMKTFNYDNSNCDAKYFINYDHHILDKTDKYSIDDIIKEEYVKKI